jgi:Asp-tRNA(Asn)/Glu-tRNA(Gln) amidotransferase A subunit family amidase
VKKKWYNFFVVTDPPKGEAGETPARERGDPPRRVADVVPNAEADTEFTTPVPDPTAFEDIYSSAKIRTPPHGYTVLKVAEMLRSEHLQALPPEVKRKSILVALEAAGVTVAEIVEDAVQRDRALDTYERVLQKHLETLRAAKDAENRALQDELSAKTREIRARIEQNEQEVSREQEQLLAWRGRKRQEEDHIAEAVGYFVSENPITRGTPSAQDTGGQPNVR